MQRAADLERAGRLEDAVREQERALAADPSNVQSHVNLISLYGRLDNPETAKEHFEAVLRLQPNRSDAWYNYGVLLLREHKDLQQAEKAFLRALDVNPDYAEARNNLGVIYEEAGRLDDAASEFRKAIASRPDYPLARFHLGRILLHQKKYEDAVHQFLRALEPESDRTPAYLYALATAYGRAGSHGEALRYLHKAHEAARARGQSQLAAAVERDLATLTGKQ
jgi:tetratricopeptide (TPR) repeat protein